MLIHVFRKPQVNNLSTFAILKTEVLEMDKRSSTTAGYIYTLQAFLAWGILPIYWKLLNSVPALEILAHRIFWSFIFLFIWLLFTKQKRIWDLLKQRKTRNSLLLSSLLIGSNWGLYIYAVNSNQIIEASLGYYITPLMNIMLGIIVLKEKLDKLKLSALIIACLSVIYLTLDYGTIKLCCKFPLDYEES